MPQHLHLKLRREDLLWKADRIVDRLLDVRGERDRRPPSSRNIYPPDSSLTPDDDRLAVRRPGVLRIQAVNRPCLLQVFVEVIEDRPIAAGLELADVQLALQTDAAHVGERLTVG